MAGGVLQGATQALITKWIGAVFIEYFRNEMQTPVGGMAGLARRQWENVTTANELRKLGVVLDIITPCQAFPCFDFCL